MTPRHHIRAPLATLLGLLTLWGPALVRAQDLAVSDLGFRVPSEEGQPHAYVFDVTNLQATPAHWIKLSAVRGFTSVTPDAIRLTTPLVGSGFHLVDAELHGVEPGAQIELDIELCDQQGRSLSKIRRALSFPQRNCLEVISVASECLDPVTGEFSYSIDVGSLASFDVAHLTILPLTPGVSFSTTHFDVNLPSGSVTTANLATNITAGNRRVIRFMLTAHDASLTQCCSIPVRLRNPCVRVIRPRPPRFTSFEIVRPGPGQGPPRFRVQLGDTDEDSPVQIQFSASLEPDEWSPLPFSLSEDGPSDTNSVEGGPPEIYLDLPAGPKGFFRIRELP